MSAQSSSDARADGKPPPLAGVQRDPERVAEDWAARVSRWTVRMAARAREEAEDIWAEAQSLRRGD